MLHLQSREYKVVVDADLIASGKSGMEAMLHDLAFAASGLRLSVEGAFDAEPPKERTILFLDTPDTTLLRNGILLRQRIKHRSNKTEYTLKCRNEDRYLAAGQDVSARKGLEYEFKFEEDVGVPFVSRFSQSTTVSFKEDGQFAGDRYPRSLQAASGMFPVVARLRRDGMPCPLDTMLAPVHGHFAFERVFQGPRLHGPHLSATFALILWTKGRKGRPLIGELSFRYEMDEESMEANTAISARRFFEAMQRFDWFQADSQTKTQFMFRA